MAITKVGRIAASISTRYVGFWPCFQAAPDSLTTLIDRSGAGNNVPAGASGIGASAWSNANQFTSSNAATTGAALPKALLAAFNFNSSVRDSLVFSVRVSTPNSNAGDTIMRTGNGSVTGGWWLETNSTGYTGAAPGVRLKMYDQSTGAQAPMGYASLPANTETTICFIIDGPGNQFYLFKDGVLATVSSGVNPTTLSGVITTSMNVLVAAALDPYFGGASPGVTDVKKLRGCHIAIVPASAGAIADPVALAARLHQYPYTALTARELP